MHRLFSLPRFGVCVLLPMVVSGCAWMPSWMGGERARPAGAATSAAAPAAQGELVIVQYRQGPRSFAAQTANEAVGVRMVQTLGVIDGALVAPPAGMTAAQAATQLREQDGVINAQVHVPRR